jgi:hypothetical protein
LKSPCGLAQVQFTGVAAESDVADAATASKANATIPRSLFMMSSPKQGVCDATCCSSLPAQPLFTQQLRGACLAHPADSHGAAAQCAWRPLHSSPSTVRLDQFVMPQDLLGRQGPVVHGHFIKLAEEISNVEFASGASH